MNFTSRSNYFTDASPEGNYELISGYEASSTYKSEDYSIRPRPIRRHSSRNVPLKVDRRKNCSSSPCVCMASPTTPRSLLPQGACECTLDSLPYLPRDHGNSVLPHDLYSALEELELESSLKSFHSRDRRSMRTSAHHISEASQNGPSTPRSRLLVRLKISATGRRIPRMDRSGMIDSELSPASSSSSSRCGSPIGRRSPAPFTPRNADIDIPGLYIAQQSDSSTRSISADLDEEMSTEPLGPEGHEQGTTRFNMPDSMWGHHGSRKYPRFP